MKQKSNYMFRGWLLSLAVALGVVALGFIPPVELCGMSLGRADILASLLGAPAEEMPVEYEADIERLEMELAALEALPLVDSSPEPVDSSAEDAEAVVESRERVVAPRGRVPDSGRVMPREEDMLAAIEDFDTLDLSRFDRFVEKLASGEGVRIAFLGDSFVEGDILTSNLREELQTIFGGRGVGFVPCDIPFATVRRTVKRESKGWSSYSIMKPKSAPESLRDKFFVSGYLASGGAGATTKWSTTTAFEHTDSCTRSRLLLLSRDSSRVEVVVNDTLRSEYRLAKDELPRDITIDADVQSVALRVIEGDVLCYGVSIEGDDGVIVDNFSVRSNNGHAIFGTGAHINRRIDELLGYDLVVLQYGLNIMQPGQRNFSKYRDQLRNMIAYAERCFPDAAIVVLGVSDRWVKSETTGEYEPIGSVDALTSYQRAAADSAHVAFWPTAEAMAQLGGMPTFVANGWAAADHTHINFRGGERLARALGAALRQPVYELLAEREAEERREAERIRRAAAEREAIRQQQVEQQLSAISAIVDTLAPRLEGIVTEREEYIEE